MCESPHRLIGNLRKTFFCNYFSLVEKRSLEKSNDWTKKFIDFSVYFVYQRSFRKFFFLMPISLVKKTHYYDIFAKKPTKFVQFILHLSLIKSTDSISSKRSFNSHQYRETFSSIVIDMSSSVFINLFNHFISTAICNIYDFSFFYSNFFFFYGFDDILLSPSSLSALFEFICFFLSSFSPCNFRLYR